MCETDFFSSTFGLKIRAIIITMSGANKMMAHVTFFLVDEKKDGFTNKPNMSKNYYEELPF